MEYTAKDLIEIANYFRTLANDQRGCIRFQQTKKAKEKCEHEAYVWEQAASILEQTKLTG